MGLGSPDLGGEVSRRFEIFDGKAFLNDAESPHLLRFLPRARFDAFLLDAAAKAGCRVERGEFRGLSEGAAVVDGRVVRFKCLVGADGVFSAVARAIGESLPQKSLAVGLQADVPRAGRVSDLHAARIFFGYLELGWGWAFPKGDTICIGLGGIPGTREDVSAVFRRLLADCEVANAGTLPIRGAKLPNEEYLREPASGNVFLCGDAAGFAEPLTGEGIHAALLSGILAAESILGGTGAEERYNEACRKQVTPIFGQARLARSLLFREPFRTLALRRFKRGKGAMRRFLGVLAGESDYKRFFLDSLLGR